MVFRTSHQRSGAENRQGLRRKLPNSVSLSATWYHQPALEFYRNYYHIAALKPVERHAKTFLNGFDYYVLNLKDDDDVRKGDRSRLIPLIPSRFPESYWPRNRRNEHAVTLFRAHPGDRLPSVRTALCAYRAATQSFVLDEAFTFNNFVGGSWRDLYFQYDANNHLLFSMVREDLDAGIRGFRVRVAPSEHDRRFLSDAGRLARFKKTSIRRRCGGSRSPPSHFTR